MLPRMVKTLFVSVMSACMVLALGLPAASEEDHDRARAQVGTLSRSEEHCVAFCAVDQHVLIEELSGHRRQRFAHAQR
ncbi:MAG: hypothetical protein K2Q10_12880, partial [Rhodospirillales bacterium]|nr:hypothetical protein [Rhodospirillales bacterium]